ncbi:MAG: hypothetical protein QG663_546, partial [Thermodesulfobacteriota bacterium]|nr:hypothetical protein [Thermodesulfobacteriota bacterium]
MVEVCFPLPLAGLYTYRVPDNIIDRVEIGKRVVAPFNNKFRAGFVVGLDPRTPKDCEIKELNDIPDEDACFDEPWWQFIMWTSKYYMTPVGLALKTAIPSGFERKSERWAKFSSEGLIWIEGLKALDNKEFNFKLPRSGSVSYKKLVGGIGKKL